MPWMVALNLNLLLSREKMSQKGLAHPLILPQIGANMTLSNSSEGFDKKCRK